MHPKVILDYDLTCDKEVYCENDQANIRAITVANSDGKPNEDSFSVLTSDGHIWIAVFDGTTSLRPIPSLQNQTGARFASHFLKENYATILQQTDFQTDPFDQMVLLNTLLLEQSLKMGGSLSDTHSLPASMATIVHIDRTRHKMKFAHIGDTYGILYPNGVTSTLFTNDKNYQFDQKIFRLIKEIAFKKSISIPQACQDGELKEALYQMFIDRNNNPDGSGSGVLNGDPNARLYIQTGEYSMDPRTSILIATDGLEIQGYDLHDPEYRNMLLKAASDDLRKLVALKKKSEDDDPERKNIRYKHSDDATGVFVSSV
jgi:serine/threonine protein phosphatase PrpC